MRRRIACHSGCRRGQRVSGLHAHLGGAGGEGVPVTISGFTQLLGSLQGQRGRGGG